MRAKASNCAWPAERPPLSVTDLLVEKGCINGGDVIAVFIRIEHSLTTRMWYCIYGERGCCV
jgi:hypothetical protein